MAVRPVTIKIISAKDKFDIEGFRRIFDSEWACRNTATFTYPYTLEKATERYHKMLVNIDSHPLASENLIWLEGDVVGSIGLFINDDGILEIGYAVNEIYQGLGIASKALAMILDDLKNSGFKGVLQAGFDKENPASGRVLEKAGFQITGDGSFYSEGAGEDRPCWRLELVI